MPLLNGHIISSMATNVDEPIYRAVSWYARPTHITQLGCPPVGKVKLGRVNTPGKPMFYGSAGCYSTIMELAPIQGECLAISKWRTTASLHLITAGYTQTAFKEKTGMNRFENLPWVNQYEKNPLSHKQGNQIVHEFLAREFTKRVPAGKEWQYKITASISEAVLNAQSYGIGDAPAIEIAGILYPSTPNEANADNVALKCHIADRYLQFVSVQYVEISQKTELPIYNILGLDFADSLSDTGDIIWKSSFPAHLIAGTDHTVKYGEHSIEILDNKSNVVAGVPYDQAGLFAGEQKSK